MPSPTCRPLPAVLYLKSVGDPTTDDPVLLISAEWQTRALLAAQIGEMAGRDALSAPGVDEALGLIKVVGIRPALLVIDAGSHITRADVERMRLALPGTPLVLCVSALRRAEFDPLREHCAAYLVRPVTIGQIAQAVVQALAAL